MSERDYAAHAGISRGAVQKARSSDRLVLHADGSIDAAASDAPRAQATNPAMQRTASRAVPTAAVEAVAGTLREHAATPSPSAGGMTFLQARTANEVLKAQERKIKVEKMKGEMVDLAMVKSQVFRLGRQERDAWQNWPSRVGALMAADLQVDPHAIQTILARYVRQHLNDLADFVLTIDWIERRGRCRGVLSRDPAADRATAARTGTDMMRGRGEIDQHGRYTVEEVRVEGSDELTFRRLSTHSTDRGQRSPSPPPGIARKLNGR